MKTKFILHGGWTSKECQHNTMFFSEFTRGLEDGAKVLFVGFAREDEAEQLEVYERTKGFILAHTDKQLEVKNATPENFVEEIAWADAIFVTGGQTWLLKERLQEYTDSKFGSLLAGKVYAGSSAGANVVSKYHTSGFAEGVQEGLGIVPVCLMAHYGDPEFNGIEEHKHWFDNYDYELITIPECHYKVFEI